MWYGYTARAHIEYVCVGLLTVLHGGVVRQWLWSWAEQGWCGFAGSSCDLGKATEFHSLISLSVPWAG